MDGNLMSTLREGTKKGSIIFMGMLLFLIWGGPAFSSDSLIATPSSLNMTLASGQLVSYQLEVINSTESPLEVKCVFDSQWMFIYPSEFRILPERVRSIWAIFFIRREESPPKEGKVEFQPENGGKPATVWVACSAPHRRTMPPPVRGKETKPDELENLRREIKERDQKIAELKKEMVEAKPHFPAMENALPQKKGESAPAARPLGTAVPVPATETAPSSAETVSRQNSSGVTEVQRPPAKAPPPTAQRSTASASPVRPEVISAPVAATREVTRRASVESPSNTIFVTKTKVKMRAEPNSSGKVVLILRKGREVEKIGESGEYTKVRLSWGDSGWVATRILRIIEKPRATKPEPAE
jgi:hypothetical protein